jgi:CRP-like cAMP-binding protein
MPPQARHVLELFTSPECGACPAARNAAHTVRDQRKDIAFIERSVARATELEVARARRLLATPALVLDGGTVLYGVPAPSVVLRHLSQAPPVTVARIAELTARPESRVMAAHSKIWYLQHFRMLDMLTTAQMAAFDRQTHMLEVRRGTPIYLEGDPSDQIFLLKSGAVKICTLTADGQQTLLAFLHPGDLFGELAIVDEAPRDHLATAHEDTVLCAMNRAMVLQTVEDTPALGYQITKLLGLRLRRFRTRVEELLCRSAPDRLAHALLGLAAECGVHDQRGILIRLRLNQADLGHLVGLDRETVNAILQDFRGRGLIEIDGRRIRITDPEGLRAPVATTT